MLSAVGEVTGTITCPVNIPDIECLRSGSNFEQVGLLKTRVSIGSDSLECSSVCREKHNSTDELDLLLVECIMCHSSSLITFYAE